MADIFDWSATAANNTTLDSINVNTGMSPGNVDNAIRSLMALVRNSFVSSWEGLLAGTTSGIPVSNGSGTISTKAAPAGTIVGTSDTQTLTNKTISGGTITGITDLAIADGGTGASTAANAFANIAVSESSLTFPKGYIKFANGLFLMWGSKTFAGGGTTTTVTYNTELGITTGISVGSLAVICGGFTGDTDRNGPFTTSCATTGFNAFCRTTSSSTGFWIAVGR